MVRNVTFDELTVFRQVGGWISLAIYIDDGKLSERMLYVVVLRGIGVE